MKLNRFVTVIFGVLCAGLFSADPAFAERGKPEEKKSQLERKHAIVQAVHAQAKKIKLKGYEYTITKDTEMINEVGRSARLRDFQPMQVHGSMPDPDTGTKVYFEADFEHNLVKLQMVREIPY
jgi:hypothetical protein